MQRLRKTCNFCMHISEIFPGVDKDLSINTISNTSRKVLASFMLIER